MKIELGEKNATIFSLEAREKAMKEQLRRHRRGIRRQDGIAAHRRNGAQGEARRPRKLSAELSDRSMMRRAARSSWWRWRTQIVDLKGRVGDAEGNSPTTHARLEQPRGEFRCRDPRAWRGAQPRRKI